MVTLVVEVPDLAAARRLADLAIELTVPLSMERIRLHQQVHHLTAVDGSVGPCPDGTCITVQDNRSVAAA